MKNRWTKTAVIALIAVLVMSIGVIAVFAQDDTTPEDPARPAIPFDRAGSHGHDKFHGRYNGAANDEALAEALGITVEELQEARQKVAADRFAQAVEDGYLTRDQANTMIAMQALKGYLDQKALLAEAFGLTVEEFEAAREAGSLRDLLANITPAELQENMQAAVQTAVQQAVTDNVITQEQADLVLEQLESRTAMRGKFGGHHDFGRGRGGFHGHHGAPEPSDGYEEGETANPFRNFRNAPAFGA